jgi:hypothetical protein
MAGQHALSNTPHQRDLSSCLGYVAVGATLLSSVEGIDFYQSRKQLAAFYFGRTKWWVS